MSQQTTKLSDAFLACLRANGGVFHGTEKFILEISTINSKTRILRIARDLEERGTIAIIPSRGGRGRKTIYKINRNSPGAPRRKRHAK
jgi:hypothetical protein